MLKTRTKIRWMIRLDIPQVVAIEEASFEYPWGEQDFIRCLRDRNCIGMVAEQATEIVGFMIYELHRDRLHLLDIAVAPKRRREEIGTAMLRMLTSNLSRGRRDRILTEVRESNLAAQMFLQQVGFRAISVLRDYYEEISGDAYLMEFRKMENQESDAP